MTKERMDVGDGGSGSSEEEGAETMDFLPSSSSYSSCSCSSSSLALEKPIMRARQKRAAEVETLRVNMNLINIDHHCVGTSCQRITEQKPIGRLSICTPCLENGVITNMGSIQFSLMALFRLEQHSYTPKTPEI